MVQTSKLLLHIQETPVYISASDGYPHCGVFFGFPRSLQATAGLVPEK